MNIKLDYEILRGCDINEEHNSKKVVAIYSIVFGAIGLIGSFSDAVAVWALVIEILLIVLGILLLIPALQRAEKGLIITGLVYYSLLVLAGLIFFFIIPFMGFVIWGLSGVPFAFSIVYLVRKGKEELGMGDDYSNPSFPREESPLVKDASFVETQLKVLAKMVEDGLITEADYEKKKNLLLDIE
jgi:hypothetical protein